MLPLCASVSPVVMIRTYSVETWYCSSLPSGIS